MNDAKYQKHYSVLHDRETADADHTAQVIDGPLGENPVFNPEEFELLKKAERECGFWEPIVWPGDEALSP
jgi:hypothetical protein